MAPVIWRRWAALCALAGVVVLPLLLEAFAGGHPVRFLALPLRWAWLGLVVVPLVDDGWLGPGVAGFVFAALAATVGVTVLADLSGLVGVDLAWFLALEWWQRPVFPWLDLVPWGLWWGRPSYLWLLAAWTLVEGAVVAGILGRARRGAGGVPFVRVPWPGGPC